MKITIHRGISQIGGCITEIESSSGARLLIDFGHNLPEGEEQSVDKYDTPEELSALLSGVTDIYYTHYHGDHIGFEAQVHALGIKQHMGALSIKMERVLKKHMCGAPSLKEHASQSLEAIKAFVPYKAGQTEHVGDIAITPYFVSHSAVDAHMFLIQCDGMTVLHTGDFRDHGYLGKGLLKNIDFNIVPKHVDVLITEGTMLSRDSIKMKTEWDLQEEFKKVFSKYKYCFVLSSSMDADRFTTLYQATKKVNPERPLVVDSYQQRLIKLVGKTMGSIYAKTSSYDFYMKKKANLLRLMHWKGFTMMVRNSETMRRNIGELMSLIGPDHLNQVAFVYSQFSGYINDKHKAFNQATYDFVHAYDWHIEEIHTSGHASREALTAVCEHVNPSTAIIPIHREAGSDFCSLPISDDLKSKVLTESKLFNGLEIIIL